MSPLFNVSIRLLAAWGLEVENCNFSKTAQTKSFNPLISGVGIGSEKVTGAIRGAGQVSIRLLAAWGLEAKEKLPTI